jgi:hypothetical protein
LILLARLYALTFVASWGVWSDGWLLILRSLVLCYEGTGHGETANSIWILELEPELAGVVVDLLNLVQRETNEALVYDTSASYVHIIPLSFLEVILPPPMKTLSGGPPCAGVLFSYEASVSSFAAATGSFLPPANA